ncbi:Crp/Fnr family transcriptional regulator [Roseicyclus persicicus]|uniref:Crp/Fnr family transcriptional regulator n=1 Tax=Roseicyclus persicicus TaxID=2650661 RepID=A0A7X6JZX2_9RHOB|nr:Crp/Fnr family transcriptional regulator [Roseibacterium persicicum]NKX45238.1 Crp/Fnr family transcriptional regulator [Roseibacterium persicicum]
MIRRFAARAGDVLFQPGSACPGFLVLDRGTIRVSLTAANGREVVLYRVSAGTVCLQTFTCLVEGEHYSAEGVVEEDVAGEMIPAGEFRARLATDDAFRGKVFEGVAQRFAEYQRLVEEVALTGFDARLARVLLRLADDAGFVAATHAALAAETASGRAVVTRRLAEFARAGVAVQEKGGVRIADRTGLERIAADTR